MEIAQSKQTRNIHHPKNIRLSLATGDKEDWMQTHEHPLGQELEPKGHRNDPLVDLKQYQRLIGKLKYLTLTRPNTAFSNSVPTKRHLDIAIMY